MWDGVRLCIAFDSQYALRIHRFGVVVDIDMPLPSSCSTSSCMASVNIICKYSALCGHTLLLYATGKSATTVHTSLRLYEGQQQHYGTQLQHTWYSVWRDIERSIEHIIEHSIEHSIEAA
jgi:hypothetical protein